MDRTSKQARRVVFVCCDGLGVDWVTATQTPVLHGIARDSLWCASHRAVFPSVTRVNPRPRSPRDAIRPDTDCTAIAWACLKDGRIVVRDVGKPDFRSHMRHATGTTLRVPTLAERIASNGGFVAFSKCVARRRLFPRSGTFRLRLSPRRSFAPGGAAIDGADALGVSHDLPGDWAMTSRFCAEILRQRQPAIAVLWLANPDLTLHGAPLGYRRIRGPAANRAMRRGSRRNRRCVAGRWCRHPAGGRLGPRPGDHRRLRRSGCLACPART